MKTYKYYIKEANAERLKKMQPEGLNNIFVHAVQSNNPDKVKELIDAGFNVNTELQDKLSPLMFAIEYNDINTCKILLDNGADINYISYDRDMLYFCNNVKILNMLIRRGGFKPKNLDKKLIKSVEYEDDGKLLLKLLELGADINYVENSDTVLLIACRDIEYSIQKIKYLIKYGANVNVKDRNGNSPLYYSVNKNKIRSVKDLLDAGAVVTKENIIDALRMQTNEKILGYLLDKKTFDINPAINKAKHMTFSFIGIDKFMLLLEHDLDLSLVIKDIARSSLLLLPTTPIIGKINKIRYKKIIKIHEIIINEHPEFIGHIKEFLSPETKEKYDDLLDSEELGLL